MGMFALNKVCCMTNINIFHIWIFTMDLIKNSIDSMKGSGDITIEINETNLLVDVLIIDTGNGIEKRLYKKIFDPGYTSKTRGWGLGLSLSKRIIEDYHKGSIVVVSSTIGKGTTIKIQLKRTVS